ncbi:MAG: TatD family hydrolase [Bacilli bacterium]|nr:TatD family hydrolase [Bacilli bacterium]MBQ6404606.1 TatD family hydrolase [Bacilli bacterium]
MYIDTHCHLSKEDYDDIDLVIKENKEKNVNRIIISGCTKETIVESIALADKYQEVYLTIGYHPSEAKIITSKDLELLEDQIRSNSKVKGIGEIGLDYHYGKEDIELQKDLFRKQMKLAEKLNLPVVIHSRDATEDTISILKEFPQVIGDIHCFSGSVETAKIYVSMGYKIGIGGVVTFKNSNLYKVIEAIGIENIVLETDAPYLAPVPVRGKKNSSKYIPYIADKLSEILNIPVEKTAEITTNNAVTLFDLK